MGSSSGPRKAAFGSLPDFLRPCEAPKERCRKRLDPRSPTTQHMSSKQRSRKVSSTRADRLEPISPARSALMSRIGPKNSRPEIVVRQVAHRLGYRFRLHRHDLPGTPDIVFPVLKRVVFVHGCFWHRHRNCSRTTTPKTRAGFWAEKFEKNIARDARNIRLLRKEGWHVLTIWECDTFDVDRVAKLLLRFLRPHGIGRRPNAKQRAARATPLSKRPQSRQ
ncbi:DNA mismatch endonuclease Vsr [Bradyrhizobium sp. USDA 4451]